MNQTETILLQAMQKSLWNKDLEFPLDTDWDAVLKEADDQAVLGIIINAAPLNVQKKWTSRASFVTAHFVRVLHYQEQLFELLKENDIPMVILKGTAAAMYYPNPAQRSMGDIDFIIPSVLFEKTKTVLAQNGYTVEDDLHYPRHIDIIIDGIVFEMHRFFSDMGIDIEEYITDGIAKNEMAVIYGHSFPTLPPLANGLVLLAHLAFHLKTGLGIRQVVDWMMFVKKNLDDRFWTESFEEAAKKSKLDVLAITATKLCQKYLGLTDNQITWCKNADDELCELLMNNLLSSGNFGKKHGSGRKVENTVTNIKREGFRYLQKAGEVNWKAYHKYRWLKPFAWVYQIGRYAKQGIHTKRHFGQIQDDFKRGKQRNDLLEQLHLGDMR